MNNSLHAANAAMALLTAGSAGVDDFAALLGGCAALCGGAAVRTGSFVGEGAAASFEKADEGAGLCWRKNRTPKKSNKPPVQRIRNGFFTSTF